MYALAISPLFGVGCIEVYRYFEGHIKLAWESPVGTLDLTKLTGATVSVAVVVSVIGIIVWPFWTGTVFTGTAYPNPGDYVEVPRYYGDAKHWLSSAGKDFRVIVLPLGGEGTTYIWNQSGVNQGFNGVNVDNLLLHEPSVSLPSGGPFDYVIEQIPGLVVANGTWFWKVMATLSAKYVIVREDSNYSYRGQLSPSLLRSALSVSYTPSINSGFVNTSAPSVVSLYGRNGTGSLSAFWATPQKLLFSQNASQQSGQRIEFSTTAKVFPPNNYSAAGFRYSLPYPLQGFDSAKYLDIWVKSNRSVNMTVALANSDSSTISWGSQYSSAYSVGPGEINRWKLIVMPILTPWSYYKSFSLNRNVTSLDFYFFGPPKEAPLYVEIGGTFRDEGLPQATTYLHFVRSFGKLFLYALDESRFVPMVYASTRSVLANGLKNFALSILPSPTFVPGKTVALVKNAEFSDFGGLGLLDNLSSQSQPILRFESADPTKYEVQVGNGSGAFLLVLNQRYDRRWVATSGEGQSGLARSPEIGPHIEVNGFANAWLINGRGNFTVHLLFEPQDVLFYGLLASGSSLTIGVSYLLLPMARPVSIALRKFRLPRFHRKT
jgi:hypothetical protein